MVDISRDNQQGEFYPINKKTLLVKWDNWEIWKGNNKSGWINTEEVKRKDYQEYIKGSNKIIDKELIEIDYQTYFTTRKEADRIWKNIQENRQQQEEQETWGNQQRKDLKTVIKDVSKALESIDTGTLSIEDIKKYKAYMDTILTNLKSGQIKDTKTTREVNKNKRLELYKVEIDNYLKEGRYQSINKLCKDLGINRATLYNLKLDSYIKKSFK